MKNRYLLLLIGVFSGFTWAVDTLILSASIGSVFLVSFLHDFGAVISSLDGIRSVRFNKRLCLGFVFGTLGSLGFIGASMLGGAIVGVVTSSSMAIITYLLSKKYNLKSTVGYIVGAILLGNLSYVSGEVHIGSIFLGILCVIGWSLETLFIEKYAIDYPYSSIVLMRMLTGIIFLIPFVFIFFTPIPLNMVIKILFAGMIGGISYRAWYCAILGLGATLGNSLNLTYLIFIILLTSAGVQKLYMLFLGISYLVIVFYLSKIQESSNSTQISPQKTNNTL